MPSLAWFTPWPPQRSGIAGRSAELVPLLAARGHAIDVFVDEQDPDIAPLVTRAPDAAPSPREFRVLSAHDFVWRQARGQYDLAIYQMGNSHLHEFIWPYLFRWPGLVVLHDARLHHARGRALLRHGRDADYRAELAWNHPEVPADVAELGIAGFDGVYYYQWPMLRSVIEPALAVASHSRGVVDMLKPAWPYRPVTYIALGEGPEHYDAATARVRFRSRHGIPADSVTFGVFGGLTEDKRVAEVLRAFAATQIDLPGLRLVLAGTPDPLLDLPGQIAALKLTEAVVVASHLNDAEFDEAVAAVDVGVHLRWPTALETSGPWVRSLAAGHPTIVIDLAHQHGVPGLDPRTWQRHWVGPDASPNPEADAVTVAVDILDEDHSLRLAIRRLAIDEALRGRLGAMARRYWEREHTVNRMRDDYERAIAMAIAQPVPTARMPAHMRPDATEFVAGLLTDFGIAPPL